MRNYIVNSRFKNGQSPQTLSSTGAWAASKFWVGPGAGGVFNVSFPSFPVGQTTIRANPEYFMRCAWTTAPTSGETHYSPAFRWTWLEHHMYQSRELVGSPVSYTGALRVATGTVYVVPIIWVNYANNDYVIYDQPGIVVGTDWTTVSGSFSIPQYPAGKMLDSGHYVGFGYDFVYQTAPVIDVAPIRLWLPEETITETPAWLDAQLSLQP